MWKKDMATSWKRTDNEEVPRQFRSEVSLELPGADPWGAEQLVGDDPQPPQDAELNTIMQQYALKLQEILRSSEDRDHENTYEVNEETYPARQTQPTLNYITADDEYESSYTPFHYSQHSSDSPAPWYCITEENRLSPLCDSVNPYIENTTVRREGRPPETPSNEGPLNLISKSNECAPQDLSDSTGALDLRMTLHADPMCLEGFHDPPDQHTYHSIEEQPVLHYDVSNVEQPVLHHVCNVEQPVLHHDVSNVEQTVLHPDVFNGDQPVLHHDVSNVEQPVLNHDVSNVEQPVLHPDVFNGGQPVLHHEVSSVEEPVLHHDVSNGEQPSLHHNVSNAEKPALHHDLSNGFYNPMVSNCVTEPGYQNNTNLAIIVNTAPLVYQGAEVCDTANIHLNTETLQSISPAQHLTVSLVPMVPQHMHIPHIQGDNIQKSNVIKPKPIVASQFVSVLPRTPQNDGARVTSISLEQFPGSIEISTPQMNRTELSTRNVEATCSSTMALGPSPTIVNHVKEKSVKKCTPFSIRHIIGLPEQENTQVALEENNLVGIQRNAELLPSVNQHKVREANVQADEQTIQPKKKKKEIEYNNAVMRPERPKAPLNLFREYTSSMTLQQQQINQEDLRGIGQHFPNVVSRQEVPTTQCTDENSPRSSCSPSTIPMVIKSPQKPLRDSTPPPERSLITQEEQEQINQKDLHDVPSVKEVPRTEYTDKQTPKISGCPSTVPMEHTSPQAPLRGSTPPAERIWITLEEQQMNQEDLLGIAQHFSDVSSLDEVARSQFTDESTFGSCASTVPMEDTNADARDSFTPADRTWITQEEQQITQEEEEGIGQDFPDVMFLQEVPRKQHTDENSPSTMPVEVTSSDVLKKDASTSVVTIWITQDEQDINQEDLRDIRKDVPDVIFLQEIPKKQSTDGNSPTSTSSPSTMPAEVTNSDPLLPQSTPSAEENCDSTDLQNKTSQMGGSSVFRVFHCFACGKPMRTLRSSLEHSKHHIRKSQKRALYIQSRRLLKAPIDNP